MNEQILIIGNFADNIDKPGGQHIRSSMIRKLAYEVYENATFKEVDLKKSKIKVIKEIIKESRKSGTIIAIMASRSTHFISIILYFMGQCKKVNYVAVGGWLPNYLKKYPYLKMVLKKMNFVILQTVPMQKKLEKMGFKNLCVLPNFRDRFELKKRNRTKKVVNFVFCARITREKGAGIAIRAIEKARKKTGVDIKIDFYGPIQDDYKESFNQELNGKIFCKYKGYIENENVVNVLSQYDCMLLPTFYPGEGFPGSILEAFLAGLPVITTDWNYNKEYVYPEKNGYLCEPNDEEDLYKKILAIMELNPSEVEKMSKNAFDEGKKYTFDGAKKIYLEAISSKNELLRG